MLEESDWEKGGNDWEASARHVAGRIEEIRSDWTQEQARLRETLDLDEESLQFTAKRAPASNAQRLARHLARIEDRLGDILALGGNNGLTEHTVEFRILTRLVRKYADDPETVAFDLTDVNASIEAQINANEYADTQPVRLLQTANSACISFIRETEPDIAAELDWTCRGLMPLL